MKKVLIANRGEIAVRIARACTDLELVSVAVYSDPDADAFHVRIADEAYPLDGTASADTYLDVAKLLKVASRARADAVHPGYGFLAENADFAQAVIDAGLIWIGPSPETIRTLGDKVSARAVAQRAQAPLAPGSKGALGSADEVLIFAEEHGFPVAIKAAFGGGGRGLKVVHRPEDVEHAFESAVRESVAAFGRGECFVEKFLECPRHVEAQVVADTFGDIVVVGTRDCSLQRRNQKLVEEAPAPFLADDQRELIHRSAQAIFRESGYVGVGTVEYLVGQDGTISFLEVNTRIQVEHSVTEMAYGVDLVATQIRIADGGRVELEKDPLPLGHAIEFRINAEDPARGFLPSPGLVDLFISPGGPGVRIDSGVRDGSVVSGDYDSLLAKLIVFGQDRGQALRRARNALEEMSIDGLPTVLPFHRAVLREPDFTAEDAFAVHTKWIETDFSHGLQLSPQVVNADVKRPRHRITVDIDGRATQIGLPGWILEKMTSATTSPGPAPEDQEPAAVANGTVTASINGTFVSWIAEDGTVVEAGQGLAVLEAMKMETTVSAPHRGTFTRAGLQPGDTVRMGQSIGTIGPGS